LEDIFGTSVSVKLDPFHSVQRCTRVIKKKDMTLVRRRDFAKAVSRVLRSSEDKGDKKRELPTANPAEISRNISSLLSDEQWKDVIPPTAVKELKKLQQKHAEKGCLR
jgi:hypothetical protein